MTLEKIKTGFKKAQELLEFALRIEMDSIIFYTEMKTNVLREVKVIDQVIEEERKHFILLSNLGSEYR